MANPRFTILSDNVIRNNDEDCFSLGLKLGPILDTIRNPRTRTPISIGIFGDWGTGKSSAMIWLFNNLLKNSAKTDVEIDAVPILFVPWKYHTREDVWRGLIAEVILNSIKNSKQTNELRLKRLRYAAKSFGLFLGKSFLAALSSLKLVFESQAEKINIELNPAPIDEAFLSFYSSMEPEKAFLNEFESALTEWIQHSLGNNTRLVIFVDDLDRCLPEISLEVLEAIKLYLNHDNIIFVIGMDRNVFDSIIGNHYRKYGVEEIKAKKYLDKMLQVEINIAPSENQMISFFNHQILHLNSLSDGYWLNNLSALQKEIIHTILQRLSSHNPRESKRMINSAFIAGCSVMPSNENGQTVRFAQAIQVFLIKKVISTYLEGIFSPDWVSQKIGQEFFYEWSSIVRNYPDILLYNKEYFTKLMMMHTPSNNRVSANEDITVDVSIIPSHYTAFIKKYMAIVEPSKLELLIKDPDLLSLMKIEFSPEIALSLETTHSYRSGTIENMPREVGQILARLLRKPFDAIKTSELAEIFELDLSNLFIDNIDFLVIFNSLNSLDLSNTQVNNIHALSGITSLRKLYLANTSISSVSPLAALNKVRKLDLSHTKVCDIGPLRGMKHLEWLSIVGLSISDLSVLSNMEGLRAIEFSETTIATKIIKETLVKSPETKLIRR